ncbi:hypothetical protein NEOLEDRAFT_1230675, partial [Neolentinus lepideus HHB14362 ss-1]
ANSISPERRRELSLEEHSSNSGLDSLVSTLSNTILIRLIRLHVLSHNTLLVTELIPILANILATLVIHRRLDLRPKLSLHLRLKDFKRGEGFTLMLQKRDGEVAGMGVDECDPVLIAFNRSNRQ